MTRTKPPINGFFEEIGRICSPEHSTGSIDLRKENKGSIDLRKPSRPRKNPQNNPPLSFVLNDMAEVKGFFDGFSFDKRTEIFTIHIEGDTPGIPVHLDEVKYALDVNKNGILDAGYEHSQGDWHSVPIRFEEYLEEKFEDEAKEVFTACLNYRKLNIERNKNVFAHIDLGAKLNICAALMKESFTQLVNLMVINPKNTHSE